MIVLDTHIWIWLVSEPGKLTNMQRESISETDDGLGVSAISCWEVAKLVERGRLILDRPVRQWVSDALMMADVHFLSLTPEIAVASTELPGEFHRDPADQIIVATARFYNSKLVTSDQKIHSYRYVETIA